MKLLTVYVILGFVWSIIGLPNLLAKSNNNAFKATGLGLFRVVTWPVLVSIRATEFVKHVKEESKDDDNEATTSTD